LTRRAIVLVAALAVAAPLPALAQPSQDPQPPATRAEALRRQREAKALELTPYKPGAFERALLALENERLFERLLNPPEGLYPKIGTVTPGSGFSAGPGYRRPGVLGGHADFSAFAAGSLKKYWMADVRLTLPRLAGARGFADVFARTLDFPSEDFFGLGSASNRDDHSTYGLRNTSIGGSAGTRPLPWLSMGGTVEHLSPRIDGGDAGASLERVFDISTIPGFSVQPDFLRTEVFADVNYREPRANPRQGGQYVLSVERFTDRGGGRYTFNRYEADMQQYISLLRNRRVLALRGLLSTSDAAPGAEVPFYLQRTLGGPDDLRGFRRFRFRDQHLLLLQVEYRWEIFTAVDGAIFYDTGKVAADRGDLDLNDLESDYGIGFRFGTVNGVFLRIEGAFGSSGGKHFIFRFGHVF
jgi:hypothetical protein